ncbi:MAG: N-acetylglucosamine-6-phosphate deacetylase [Rhizobium sp.]
MTSSTATAIVGARLFDGVDWHEDATLVIEDGKIIALDTHATSPGKMEQIDAHGYLLVPGFVDLQVNGGGGVLFNNMPTLDGIARICSTHAAFGTTALLVTLITDTPETGFQAVAAGKAAREACIPGYLGLHLEGPHISQVRKGTHDPAQIRPMEAVDLEALCRSRDAVGTLLATVAPENVSPDQVAALARAGIVVSLGHTDASCKAAKTYAAAGATMVTHLFNAMSPLGHREPGLVGAALDTGTLHCGLIADGFHVDPLTMGVALRAKRGPGHLFLVTDAMSTIGSDQDGFELNGRRVYRRDGRLTLADGTLAGADIDMLSSVRYVYERVGLPLEEALRMASVYPAEAIGAANKGCLKPGCDADFLLLSPNLDLHSTWISGNCVFNASAENEHLRV